MLGPGRLIGLGLGHGEWSFGERGRRSANRSKERAQFQPRDADLAFPRTERQLLGFRQNPRRPFGLQRRGVAAPVNQRQPIADEFHAITHTVQINLTGRFSESRKALDSVCPVPVVGVGSSLVTAAFQPLTGIQNRLPERLRPMIKLLDPDSGTASICSSYSSGTVASICVRA